MKKILNKLGAIPVIILFFVNNAHAQLLPLLQGDAVVTHSPNADIVVRIVHTNNTTTAPLGSNWNATIMNPVTPVGLKPVNDYYSNWKFATLGTVFGITLDQNTPPNIYVSSTQIYSSGTSYDRIIYRLDGTSGANTTVFDFNTISTRNSKSLGNLKYAKINGIENIYVSDWGDGVIRRITGNSATGALWTIRPSFDPVFGVKNDNDAIMPYGLAIRNMPGGGYRLYYSKISTNSNSNSIGGYGNNEIWSIGLSSIDGDFIGTETQENIIPSMNKIPKAWSYYSYVLPVIADIAFTDDGKQMLVGQQSWGLFGAIAPHNSSVYEFKFDTPSSQWVSTWDYFPSGVSSQTNAVGGVSYSNNILQGNSNALACDTTVWLTSDAIKYVSGSPPFIYGLQGMNANGGLGNSLTNSIEIDEDDRTDVLDKIKLGDVEVYKIPQNCNVCKCGYWKDSLTLNGTLIPPGRIIPSTGVQTYPIQFVQGNVSGVINAIYQCTGTCGATYTWSITNDATSATVETGIGQSIDLARYNSEMPCGKYTLIIKAKCGNTDCGSRVIPIRIICEPPPCCNDKITITKTGSELVTVPNVPTPDPPYSSGSVDFSISTTSLMSEVRVSVEDFSISSSSPNCLVCNNRPVNWGNILGATLNGSMTGTLSGNPPGPATGSLQADYREAFFSSTSPISLDPGSLSIKLSLPEVTGLECCTIKVHLCLKFTFKNTLCCETVQMVCRDFDLVTKKGGGVLNTGDVKYKIFDVKH